MKAKLVAEGTGKKQKNPFESKRLAAGERVAAQTLCQDSKIKC